MKTIFLMMFLFTLPSFAQLSLRNTMHVEQDSKWTYSAQYSLGTDLLDKMEPRLYSHSLSLSPSYDYSKVMRFGANLNVNYESLDNQIAETQQGYGRSKLSGSIYSSYRFKTPFLDSHNVSISYFLPMDRFSRREGYKGVPSMGTSLVKAIIKKRLTFIQNFRTSYLINDFKDNSSGRPNRTYSVSASPMLSLKLSKYFSLIGRFGIRWSKLTDKSSDYSYFNEQILSFRRNSLSVFVSHANGGYTQNGRVSLWYIDKNRKYVDIGVGYDF